MKQINKILLKEFRAHAWSLVFLFFLIFLTVGWEAAAPWAFKVLIDNVLGGEAIDLGAWTGKFLRFFTSTESLGFGVVLFYCTVSIFGVITQYFVNVVTKKTGQSIIDNFSRRAFNNLEQLAIGYYKKQQIGDYIYRLGYDVSALGTLLEAGIVPLVTNTLFLLTTAVILFYINPQLGLLGLAMLPVLIVGLNIFNRRIGIASERSEASNSALFSFIQEVLSQLRIIQAFNQEARQSALFMVKEKTSLRDEIDVYGFGFLLNLLIGVIIAIGYAIVIMEGVRAVLFGEISTGVLIVFIFYLDNLINPLLNLMNAASSFREDYVKVSRLGEFFSAKFHLSDQGTIARLLNPTIVFDHVSVRTDQGAYLLKQASFTIPAGKRTVVVGVSGSGKTTLISLILRFIEPTSGSITIGGQPVNRYMVKSLREAITYVPQELVLFNDTIRNNIIFGNSEATEEDIKKAVHLAVADKFINHLPGQYEFVVGEEGGNLSGGQRQRLMLARAFLKYRSRIIIMDEPLSALDVKTRVELMKNLLRFTDDKTTIIITNILEIIHQADFVILVNGGKILHAGDTKGLLGEKRLASLIVNSA